MECYKSTVHVVDVFSSVTGAVTSELGQAALLPNRDQVHHCMLMVKLAGHLERQPVIEAGMAA